MGILWMEEILHQLVDGNYMKLQSQYVECIIGIPIVTNWRMMACPSTLYIYIYTFSSYNVLPPQLCLLV